MGSRTIQTRGVEGIDLVKVSLIKKTNKNNVGQIDGRVQKTFTVVDDEENEAATDGVFLSVHAEGSIDDEESDLELDYDEEVGLIEGDPQDMPDTNDANKQIQSKQTGTSKPS